MRDLKNKKVLLINCGPHKNGTSAKMLEVAKNECLNKEYDVKVINLYDYKIDYCKGCMYCTKNKKCCNTADDMEYITNLIKESNKIILATPTYWANVPGALKNMFDRLYGVALEETKTFPKGLLKGRSYSLLVSCRTPMPFARIFKQGSMTIRMCKEFFGYAGMKYEGSVLFGGTEKSNVLTKGLTKRIKKIC